MTGRASGKAVHFDDRHLHVELEDGRLISTPSMVSRAAGRNAARNRATMHLFVVAQASSGLTGLRSEYRGHAAYTEERQVA